MCFFRPARQSTDHPGPHLNRYQKAQGPREEVAQGYGPQVPPQPALLQEAPGNRTPRSIIARYVWNFAEMVVGVDESEVDKTR